MRSPLVIGSRPSAAQATSITDTAGSQISVISLDARSSSTVRSATIGEPGTQYKTSPPGAARAKPIKSLAIAS